MILPAMKRGGLGLGIVLGLVACATSPRDPLGLVADREAEPSRRLRALAQLPRDDQAAVVLHAVLWDDRQPTDLRLAAMDWLIAHDAAAFRAAVSRQLPRIERWELLVPLCQRVADKGWADLSGTLVRSWARPSKQMADADRPEQAALARLHPGTSGLEILWPMVADEDATTGASAWEVLVRISGRDDLIGSLQQQSGPSPLLADLRAGWIELGILPRTREQVAWLGFLRSGEGRSLWDDAVRHLREADVAEPALALRHVAVVAQAGPGLPDRTELLRRWERARAGLGPAVPREGDEVTTMPSPHGEFPDHQARLGWADVLSLTLIAEQIQLEPTRRALFAQADADLADEASEHGGVLAWRAGAFEPVAYPSMLRGNDHRYVPPPRMIEAMYTALAHYHFHAQRHDNRAYAGPGGGDLAFADRFSAACLVFTFIDRDTLNVDYYHEGSLVIDLGCLHRP